MKWKAVKIGLSWILMPLVLVLILAFNNAKQEELLCQEIYVEVEPIEGVYFITQKDVLTKLSSRHEQVVGTPIASLDLAGIEALIKELAHISDVRVYGTIDGRLHLKIKQRRPIVRMVYPDGAGFYIDEHGLILPLSKNFTARVLAVNGQFPRKLLGASTIADFPLLEKIYGLADYISENDFLKAQLQQLYVNENQDFEFIPRVGNHIIEFGDSSDMATKFENLQIFYREGLAYKGWNRYKKISLKYNNQVVCTKK